ncbi:DUF1295 domain-containing protein [bacterium]|nr:DUF1295 domain-containing protein [bacterium]
MTATNWLVAGLLVAFGCGCLWATYARRPKIPGRQQMSWSLYALFAIYVVIWVCSLLEHLFWRQQIIWWVTIPAVAVHYAGLMLRLVAIRTLGRYWSLQIEIRADHQLIRHGPYRWLRHPNYLAVIIEVLTMPLVANAWATLGLAVVTLVPLLAWRIRVEERAMIGQFGDQYRRYQHEVGALVPRWATGRARRSGS